MHPPRHHPLKLDFPAFQRLARLISDIFQRPQPFQCGPRNTSFSLKVFHIIKAGRHEADEFRSVAEGGFIGFRPPLRDAEQCQAAFQAAPDQHPPMTWRFRRCRHIGQFFRDDHPAAMVAPPMKSALREEPELSREVIRYDIGHLARPRLVSQPRKFRPCRYALKSAQLRPLILRIPDENALFCARSPLYIDGLSASRLS